MNELPALDIIIKDFVKEYSDRNIDEYKKYPLKNFVSGLESINIDTDKICENVK